MPGRLASGSVALGDEIGHTLNYVVAFKQRNVPLVRHLDGFHAGMTRRHGGHRRRREDIRSFAVNNEHRHTRQASNSFHSSGNRRLDIDGSERAAEGQVLGRNQEAITLLTPSAFGACEPLFRCQFRELAVKHTT